MRDYDDFILNINEKPGMAYKTVTTLVRWYHSTDILTSSLIFQFEKTAETCQQEEVDGNSQQTSIGNRGRPLDMVLLLPRRGAIWRRFRIPVYFDNNENLSKLANGEAWTITAYETLKETEFGKRSWSIEYWFFTSESWRYLTTSSTSVLIFSLSKSLITREW